VNKDHRNLCDGLRAFLGDESQTVFDGFREQVDEIFLRLVPQSVAADVSHPSPHVRHPLEVFRVTEHHAAAETRQPQSMSE